MKRRGFLGLLGSLPFAPKAAFPGRNTFRATVATPSISFANDSNTGIYRPGSNEIKIETSKSPFA